MRRNSGLYSIAPGALIGGCDPRHPVRNAAATNSEAGAIGRITTDGHVSEFSRGITRFEGLRGIAAGPDGAMWFTECESDCGFTGKAKTGRITMNGRITEYSNLTPSSHPSEIVQGPDGNMWLLEENMNRVARIRIVGKHLS